MKHNQKRLDISCFALALVAILLSVTFPAILNIIAPVILFLSVVILGIPHGAIDHIVASKVYGLASTIKDTLLFYGSYLLVMLIVGILWILFPLGGLIFFLIISIYHFGQADGISLLKNYSQTEIILFSWSRGIMIIGLILFAHPYISLPIISAAIRTQPDWLITLYQQHQMLTVAALVPYLWISFRMMLNNRITLSTTRYISESTVIILLFLMVHPLVSFAIYFALWHSAGHISEMRDYFKDNGDNLSIKRFYKLAMPFTLISLVGLGMLFYVHQAFLVGDQMISLLFILISVLTLPHMIVVDKLFQIKIKHSNH